jgi:hypothetical protein
VTYQCLDENRRRLVEASATLNGIDYIEVIDSELPSFDPLRQRTLLVHCFKPISGFTRANVVITGGTRTTNIVVTWAAAASPKPTQLSAPGEGATAAVVAALTDAPSTLVVRVADAGDFSSYTLQLVASALDWSPPPNFDPQLSSMNFWFKVDCPSDFDCLVTTPCPPALAVGPVISYLARDYTTFAGLMLDRIAQLSPAWGPTGGAADFGQAIVELLAYVGDQISYEQDAIATEGYIGTARRRISLRRLGVLVDYAMHDGCNARAFVQLQIAIPSFTPTKSATQFLTRCSGFPTGLPIGSDALQRALQTSPQIFEPLECPTMHQDHNAISFYTWSDDLCCLDIGATSATLKGSHPFLNVGDLLLFEEVKGPKTGAAGDADPTHRQVVRLTSLSPTAPATLTDPLTGAAITKIAWGPTDALTFPLCISSQADSSHGGQMLEDVSIARGNLILVDHGATVSNENLGVMPAPGLFLAPTPGQDACASTEPVPISPRFHPTLAQGPLTQQGQVALAGGGALAPFDPSAAASSAMTWPLANAAPAITLTSALLGQPETWTAQRSLLESSGSATDFVVEVDDWDQARIRFGDNEHGAAPATGSAFTASYRAGNGSIGNVGAETILHMVASPSDLAAVTGVRNPLAAAGGVDPETNASVRRNAPQAFRVQERAVTPFDYAVVAEMEPGVRRAESVSRWTGSWYTMFTAIDPQVGTNPASLIAPLQTLVDGYRMMGVDLEFDSPIYVSLEIEIHVCVADGYFRADVEAALLQVLGNKPLPNGSVGLFYPDNFDFGQTVYMSPIYAAVHSVAGVASAQVIAFERQGTPDPGPLAQGEMKLAANEIARLDNDPNYPEHGVLRLDLNGGN